MVASIPDHCPACDSVLDELGSGIEVPICQSCGLVLHDTEGSSLPVTQARVQTTDEVDVVENPETTTDGWWTEIEINDSSDQRLVETLARMDTVTEELDVDPQTRIQAAEVVTNAWERRFMHGRREDATVGASVYAACRKSGHPRPIGAVAEAANVNKSSLQSTYRTLTTKLEIQTGVALPGEYVPYLRKRLNLSDEVATDTIDILSNLNDVSGNPVGVAAAALYIAADAGGESISLRKIGQTAGVTKETVWRKATAIRRQ